MMKNLLLLGLAFTASVGAADAQNQKANLRGKKLVAVPIATKLDGDAYFTGSRTASTPAKNHKVMAGSWGTQIGKTYYDLPSNSAVANRIVRNADGTISVSWTETCDANTSATGFPNRGAGYNYYNGTSWVEGTDGTCDAPSPARNFGVASKRVGWPEVVVLPNGKEMIFTHSSANINVTSRPTKGTGGIAAWGATTDLAFTGDVQGVGNAGTWPRAVNGANPSDPTNDDIHMVYTLNKTVATGSPAEPVINGVRNPMVYSRSTDGGVTWDKQNIFLPGMVGITNPPTAPAINTEGFARIGGDGYAIAARGNTVAIVAGYFGYAWTLWKSTDNGNTFTRRVISKLTPADTAIINGGADTVAFTNDNSHAVVIDGTGKVHVFAGQILTKISTRNNGTTLIAGESWYPNSGEALLYWNDGMAVGAKPKVIAEIEDSKPASSPLDWVANGNANSKRTPYGTMGLVSMANAAVDADNNVYVVYCAAVEGTTNNGAQDGQPFRDIYIKKMFGPTATGGKAGKWSPSINISRQLGAGGGAGVSTAENFEESVFPSIAHYVGTDNKVHMTFMVDYEPGMNLGADVDPELENFIMYYAYDGTHPDLNRMGIKEVAAYVNSISAYPNPTTDKFTVNVDLKKDAKVSVRVTNIMGQEVANVASKQMAAGNTAVQIDMNGLANGVYLYTVTSDNFTVTNRIVKQ